MKIKRYLREHPDLPPAVVKVLKEADSFVGGTGDDPVSLALAVADMLAGKKRREPVQITAATTTTYAVYPGLTPPSPTV